jgi:signal transduction histidine kinase
LLESRVESVYTKPLSRVLDRLRDMDADEWSRSRDYVIDTMDAGAAALGGLTGDVERYLECTVVRESETECECDLGEIVGQVVEKVLVSPEYRGVSILVDTGEIPPVLGYRRMIESAIEEVVRNAATASIEGRKKVLISGREAGDFVRLEIEDTGPGIPRGLLDSVFQPFFTTREGRTGLGLATVQRIIRYLDGRLGVEDRDDVTVFYLDFPRITG